MTEITRDIAAKVLEIVDAGLSMGIGKPLPGHMCVEAAVCYALGLPHGDDPGCVDEAVRNLKIRLNDATRWRDNADRARGLRRLAIAQLGSKGAIDSAEFARRVAGLVIRTCVPTALRSAAARNQNHAEPLRAASDRCEAEGTIEAVLAARATANAVYVANAAYAAYDAASAAYDAVYVANAAYAAYDAASAANAVYATYAANAVYVANAAALHSFAEGVVQVLVAMDAPGCAFLDLAPIGVE
jgi:hypothetical protein